MTDDLTEIDLGPILDQPTRLRATAAAFALILAHRRPSLKAVAALAGVSTQSLYQDHVIVVDLVKYLRTSWKPQTDTPISKLEAERDQAKSALARERTLRQRGDDQLLTTRHYLEDSDAEVRRLRRIIERHEPQTEP